MKNYLTFLFTLILMAACQGNDNLTQDKPYISKDYISVTPNMQLLADGQSTELSITADCMWTISVSEKWLSVSPTVGTNSQQITISAEKNATGQERTATLTITGEHSLSRKVIVIQPSVTETTETKTLAVNPHELEFQDTGETKSLSVFSNINWNANGPDWCTISPATGTGDNIITVTVGENPNNEERTGVIIISGEGVAPVSISISQKAKTNDDPTREPNSEDNRPPT